MSDYEPPRLDEDEVDRIGRAAGAELRRPAPESGAARIAAAGRRQRTARTLAVGTVAVASAVAVVAIVVSGRGDREDARAGPPASTIATAPTDVLGATTNPAPVPTTSSAVAPSTGATSSDPTVPAFSTAPESTPASGAQLRGDGLGVVAFGVPEADAISVLAADHGTPIAPTPPENSATPSASGCVFFADSMYHFPSGLMVGVTDGVLSSWAFAGGTEATADLTTPSGIKWGDSIDGAKRAYGERYAPADLLPLYSWGGNVRVVATVDDHGPVVLGALEEAPMDGWSGRVWLLSAGVGCVPDPIVVPVGPLPIGERYVVRLNECLCSYDLFTADGTPTGREASEDCVGRAACVLSVRSEPTADWEELWAVQRVDRENDENVWQVFDVFVPEPDTDVVSLGYCESVSSGSFRSFYAARQDSDGRALWVLTLDENTVSFVEQPRDEAQVCHYGPGAHGSEVEFVPT